MNSFKYFPRYLARSVLFLSLGCLISMSFSLFPLSSGWREKGQQTDGFFFFLIGDGFILYKTKDEKKEDKKDKLVFMSRVMFVSLMYFILLLFPIINSNSSSLLNISNVTVTAGSFMIRYKNDHFSTFLRRSENSA